MTIKDAMAKIRIAMIELFGEEVLDVRLEEISAQNANQLREITVSFLVPEKNPQKNPLSAMAVAMAATISKDYTRLYKIIEFDMGKGEIVAIRMFRE